MKRLLALFIVLSLIALLSGCKNKEYDSVDTGSEISIILPSDDTVNGYRQESSQPDYNNDSSAVEESIDGYYVNTKTKKFHKLSCTYAQKGSQNGIWSESGRDELINEGYSPCGKCQP